MRTLPWSRSSGLLLALAGLFTLSAVLAPGTLSGSSISSMLPFAAVLAIVSIGQTLVVQQGGIDLSVPGTMSMAAVIVTRYPAGDDGRLALGVIIALAAAALAGFVNGLLVTRLHVTPIVATLGLNALLMGIVRTYSGGVASDSTRALSDFFLAKTLGVSNTVLLAVGFTVAISVLIYRTVPGRRFVAAGAAPHAAHVAGIRVKRHVLGGYISAALCYAVAAIMLAGYLQTPTITLGDPYLLAPIAAVVIGGTTLGRGKASVVASAGGALFLSQLAQLILGLGAPAAVQLLVQAAVIGVAAGARGLDLRGGLKRLSSSAAARRNAPASP